MGYAIMRMAKLKTESEMNERYNHDMRIYAVASADPLRSSQNIELVDQLNGRTYHNIFEDTVLGLKMNGAINREIRHDAVKGIDVYLGFSHEDADGMDLDEWARRNVKWLEETYNPPGREMHYTDRDGNEVTEKVNNVKSVVLHMDEATPHIHAFIVPIDERGHLNAKAYVNGRETFIRMQDSYAAAMEPFGLWRGEKHSLARHEKRSEYYRHLLKAVETKAPEPLKGEPIHEYQKRVDEAMKTNAVHHRDEIVRMQRTLAKGQSAVFEERREMNHQMQERESILQQREDELDEKYAGVEKGISMLLKSVGAEEMDMPAIRKIQKKVKSYDAFTKGLVEYPDRQKAEAVKVSCEDILRWSREKEQRTMAQAR